MTIFDRERRKHVEETAREVEKLVKERRAFSALIEQVSISLEYLYDSPFPDLLEELAGYLNRPKKGVTVEVKPVFHQKSVNPSHEDYGAAGLALEKRRTKFKSYPLPWPFGEPRSYKLITYIEIIALPNGIIKVKCSPLGMAKTTLSLDQWHDPRTGKDVAERAIHKAWKAPYVKFKTGDGWLGKKMEDWDEEDKVYWEASSWLQRIIDEIKDGLGIAR